MGQGKKPTFDTPRALRALVRFQVAWCVALFVSIWTDSKVVFMLVFAVTAGFLGGFEKPPERDDSEAKKPAKSG